MKPEHFRARPPANDNVRFVLHRRHQRSRRSWYARFALAAIAWLWLLYATVQIGTGQ